MSLELSAMRWLWLEQKCLIVLQERTPKYGMGQPDVIGVTPGRYLTEIEIKRSLSDFKSDFKKPHRVVRMARNPRTGEEWEGMHSATNHPRLFYYLTDQVLAEKIKDLIPEWAGQMVLLNDEHHYNVISIIKRAPINKDSTPLNLKQCARLARQMTAHMMGYAMGRESRFEQYKNAGLFSYVDWIDCSVGTYEI